MSPCSSNIQFISFTDSNSGIKEVISSVNKYPNSLIFTNPTVDNLSEIERLLTKFNFLAAREIPIIALIKDFTNHNIKKLLSLGVSDFVYHPFTTQEIKARIDRYIDKSHEEIKTNLKQHLKQKLGLKNIIGQSPNFLSEIEKIPQIAQYDATVMITGETGTGKEIVARAIHHLSPRSGMPFITFDCGAVPPELVENELFGHFKGAYTSATSSETGLINAAEGGTLFLDEIDALNTSSQVKLLRLLQEKEYKPLGSAKIQKADIRFIAASNKNLKKAVKEGRFRSDLYYRLNIIPLKLPSLNKRTGDISLLAEHFLVKYINKFQKILDGFSDAALQKLQFYDWPGNVRELENTIERAVVLCRSKMIEPEDISLEEIEDIDIDRSFKDLKSDVIERFETSYIKSLLIKHDGNVTKAATAAQKNRRAFWQLMKKYNIDVSSH